MQQLKDTPAQIIQALLTTGTSALFSLPALNQAWPLYVSSMPDGTGSVDECGVTEDTSGVQHGRLLASGKTLESFGVQIRTRSSGSAYPDGMNRLNAVATQLDSTKSRYVTVTTAAGGSGNSYKIDTIRRTSPVLSLGEDQKRRGLFSLNLLVTLEGI